MIHLASPRVGHGLVRLVLAASPWLAAAVFGGWAAFVNLGYGGSVAARAGLGQGGYALVATWLVTRTAVSALRLAGGGLRGAALAFPAALSVMIALPLAVHLSLGTPEIAAAMAPGLLWGSGYVIALLAWQIRGAEQA